MYYDLFTDPVGLSARRERANFEASRQDDAEILEIAQVCLLHELAAHPVVVTARVKASGAHLHGVRPDTQHHRVARAKHTAFISVEVELAAADNPWRYEVPW